MPTYPDERTVIARVEKMLDAAERGGLDLRGLEMRRRKLAHDMAEYDKLVGEFGDARELERSIELGVDVLASAFVCLRSMVERGAALDPLALRVALRYRRDLGGLVRVDDEEGDGGELTDEDDEGVSAEK